MITCICNGGLGNQLFQFAAALTLAEYNNTSVQWYIKELEKDEIRSFELPELLTGFNFTYTKDIPVAELKSKLINRFNPLHKRHYIKDNFNFKTDLFPRIKSPVTIDGYWQYNQIISAKTEQYLNEELAPIMLKPKHMVALHLRGGDYIKKNTTAEFHGNLDLSYYEKAMEHFSRKYSNVEFHLFSDTPEEFNWPIFKDKPNCIWMEQQDTIKTFHSMKSYSNYIIANSSYSWWAAKIEHPDKEEVIAPKQWFKDSKMQNHNPSLDSWLLL